MFVTGGCAPQSTQAGSESGRVGGKTAAPRPTIVTEPTAAQEPVLVEANAASESGDYQDALLLFRDLLSENPTLVDAHLGLGRTYERMGDLDKAEPPYARAASLDS